MTSDNAVAVMEVWHLKPEMDGRAFEIMQEMDDLVGPNAHEHPGWSGHAYFYQSQESPHELVMLYPWRSQEEHAELVEQEKPLLAGFYDKYCASPREIRYYDELPVDVDHRDEDHAHDDHESAGR